MDIHEYKEIGTGNVVANADCGFMNALRNLGTSIAVTIVPNKIVVIGLARSSLSISELIINDAKGVCFSNNRLAVAGAREITIFANTLELAAHCPKFPGQHDAYFHPRITHYTGNCDIHDIVLDGNSVIAANTRFSTICRVDGRFSFTPLWQPPFIDEVVPEDRCHLNGFAVAGQEVRFATVLGASNEKAGWRKGIESGCVIDVRAGVILCSDLWMPHSPRIVDGRLLLLETGTGKLIEVNTESGEKNMISSVPGLARGLSVHNGVAFVGLSLLRKKEGKLYNAPISDVSSGLCTGVAAVDLATGSILGLMEFTSGAIEVYDVAVLPGITCPAIASDSDENAPFPVELPNSGFWINSISKR